MNRGMSIGLSLGFGALAGLGLWGAFRRPGAQSSSLGGILPFRPLHMAEFIIGRNVGEKIGTVYGSGPRACRVGAELPAQVVTRGKIPFAVAREQFLAARQRVLGAPVPGATLMFGRGVWQSPSGASVEEDVTIGQLVWFRSAEEPSAAKFEANAKAMCEDLACRLAQEQVMLRYYDGSGQVKLTSCSARGKATV